MSYDGTPRLSQQEAEKIVRPIMDRLCNCVTSAWDCWTAMCVRFPNIRQASGSRARCSLVYALIRENVRNAFLDDDDVTISERLGFIQLNIGGKVSLRFKKVDRNFRSSNYPTKQHLLYQAQLPLYGDLLEPVRLTVGYVLDVAATKISDIVVIYPHVRNAVWAFSITQSGSAKMDHEALPFADADVDATSSKVRSKFTDKRKREKGIA